MFIEELTHSLGLEMVQNRVSLICCVINIRWRIQAAPALCPALHQLSFNGGKATGGFRQVCLELALFIGQAKQLLVDISKLL